MIGKEEVMKPQLIKESLLLKSPKDLVQLTR